MPGDLTALTEITTALGMLGADLDTTLRNRPTALAHVPDDVWQRLLEARRAGRHGDSFSTAFANGQALLRAEDGLRGRSPRLAEWKGPHRPPGDEVIPADLRIDHVYLVSCKYLSKVLLNPGPQRLFERLLVGDERSAANWFTATAPDEFQALYTAVRVHTGLRSLPADVAQLSRDQQVLLKSTLRARAWPDPLQVWWADLCGAVSSESAARWSAALTSPRDRLRMLWRLLRISSATYFVLGTDRTAHLRLRVASAWDWMQRYELRALDVTPRTAGQPEVGWNAVVWSRADRCELTIDGHVEIRWSHGRFLGAPEAKVYLDTPHHEVPGYHRLV